MAERGEGMRTDWFYNMSSIGSYCKAHVIAELEDMGNTVILYRWWNFHTKEWKYSVTDSNIQAEMKEFVSRMRGRSRRIRSEKLKRTAGIKVRALDIEKSL